MKPGNHNKKNHKRLTGWQRALAVLLGVGLVASCALIVSQTIEDRRIAAINRRNQQLAFGADRDEGDGLVVLTPTPGPGETAAPTMVEAAETIEAAEDSFEVEQTPAPAAPTATPSPTPTVIPDSTVTAAAAPTTKAGDVDVSVLTQLNSDAIGWLTMDSVSTINFAVVQGHNAFYLKHDFDKNPNSYGTPFLDEGSPLASQPDNLIVYAHNMRNGLMFGELNRVLEDGRFIESPYVHFYTIFGDMDFIPFAVVELSINPNMSNFFQYYVPNFTGPGQFIDYVSQVERVSRVTLPWHAEYGDQLMTLVTCGQKDDERLVVFLRAVRDSEKPAS